jgi:hypothetical protein
MVRHLYDAAHLLPQAFQEKGPYHFDLHQVIVVP